jgi:hypothetical protein
VNIDPDVAAVGHERIACVDAHTNSQLDVRPTVLEEGALALLGCGERIARIREGDEEAVALRVDLDSSVPQEARAEQPAVVCQDIRVSVAERAQQLRRPFDVGEQEGDATRRKVQHSQ